MTPPTPVTRPTGWRERIWPGWMSRDISLVLFARLAMSAFRALAGIITPIYLVRIGFSAAELGLLFVAVAITSALLSATVGLLADRIGRKPFLIALPLLAGLAAMVFATTRSNIPLLFIFAGLGSFGRGAGAGGGMIGPYQPAEQALLADSTPVRARNDVFGRVGFFSSLGALIGGPLAALPDALPDALPHMPVGVTEMTGYRIAFLVMAGLAVVAALLVIPIAETRHANQPHPSATASATRGRWNPLRTVSPAAWPVLLRLWATNSVNGLAVGFFGPFITYWFYVRYGAGPGTIGVIYTLINIAALASNLYAPRLAARLGLVRAIFVGRILQSI
ncbi:MAG: MFS transporter, partial [Chloroflexota bacterium]|nr:MFS transporter [Chloroflexota bacterium]